MVLKHGQVPRKSVKALDGCYTQVRRNEFSIGAASQGNKILSMKAERAKRAERLTAWGPGARSRGPWRLSWG